MILSIQHYLRENKRIVSFMEDAGVGINMKQVSIIYIEEGDKMLVTGILGSDTPDKLRNTVLFLTWLDFALRGVQGHYNLRKRKHSQLALCNVKGSENRWRN